MCFAHVGGDPLTGDRAACDGRAVAAQGECDSHHTVRQGSGPWGTEGRAFGALVSFEGDMVACDGRAVAARKKEARGAPLMARGSGAPAHRRYGLRSAITSLRHWWRRGTVDGEPIGGTASSLSARLPVTTLSVCRHGATHTLVSANARPQANRRALRASAAWWSCAASRKNSSPPVKLCGGTRRRRVCR